MAENDFGLNLNVSNGDPRVACVVLADVSSSMDGQPIRELGAGFASFCAYLKDDELARKRVEVAVVTFASSAQVLVKMQEGRTLEPAAFHASGSTNMAAGIDLALDLLDARKAEYKEAGLEYFRPWLLVLTDGAPNDPEGAAFTAAVQRLNTSEARNGINVFPVGVGAACDYAVLGRLSNQREPARLDGLKFEELFSWLSKSLKATSESGNYSSVDEADLEQVPLPSPSGWMMA